VFQLKLKADVEVTAKALPGSAEFERAMQEKVTEGPGREY
jgi:hypothetical protein